MLALINCYLNLLLQRSIFGKPYVSTKGIPSNVQLYVYVVVVVFGLYVGYRVWRTLENEKIRNRLIDKILSIKNKDFLEALDKLISSSSSEPEIVELTNEQRTMLEMSEQDIKNGRLISQEAMDKRNLERLGTM